MKNDAFFSYQAKNSLIHRLSPLVKLLSLPLFMVLLFVTKGAFFIVLCLSVLVLALLAQTRFLTFFRILSWSFLYFIFLLIFSFSFKDFSTNCNFFNYFLAVGEEYKLYLCRLGMSFLVGSIFYETTGTVAIKDAIELFFSFFTFQKSQKKAAKISSMQHFSLVFSLTILYIPRIFSTWTTLNYAWRARLGKNQPHKFSLIQAFNRLKVLIPALLVSLLETAQDTARAIENRSA